jgi:hypothetical protein
MTLNAFMPCRRGFNWRARIACVCAVSSIMGTAFGTEGCGSLDRAENAIHMAEILYPELKGRELTIQFSHGTGGPLSGPSDAASLLIAVDKPEWHAPGETDKHPVRTPQPSRSKAVEVELPLYLQFDFIRTIFDKTGNRLGTKLSCWPVQFSNANAVLSKQMHDAWVSINAHPEWTDGEDLKAARELGMQFGPEKKTDLLRILPLKELSSIYSPLQITEAKFKVTGLKEPESSFADLHWYITAKREGGKKTLQIMVEPFHGRITAISDE